MAAEGEEVLRGGEVTGPLRVEGEGGGAGVPAGGSGETVVFRVRRYDPESGVGPYYQEYEVPYRPGMTVLDGLLHILREVDQTLSLRYSCRQKICGSCAMLINGRERLACETQVAEVGRTVTMEPLPHLPVIKDLVVDVEPFLDKMKASMPYLIPRSDSENIRVPPEEFERYRVASDCIWCAACYSACPAAYSNPYYLGPAALGQLFRFEVDSREDPSVKPLRLVIADDDCAGVWRCHQAHACSEVCPKHINPGELIAELKREVLRARISGRI